MLIDAQSMNNKVKLSLVLVSIILKCCAALLTEAEPEPITFKNVKIYLISQLRNTSGNLYIPEAYNLRDFIIDYKIDTVRVNNQVIPTLYQNSVKDIRNVAVYDLSSNQIEGIQEGAFGNLGLVQAFNLSSNLIRVIRSDVFTNIDVKFLFLGYNRIYKIEDGAFKNSRHLYYIDLSHNRIRSWDWRWFRGTAIKGINMKYNSLEYLPEDSFKFLDDLIIPDHQRILHHLLFDHNEIKTIHRLSLPRLNKLVFFDLSYNYIETIQKGTFDSIDNLDKLDLSYNMVMYLDRNLFKHTKVGYINLKSNYLLFINVQWASVVNFDLNPLEPNGKKEWLDWKKEKGRLLDSPEYS